MKEAEVRDRLGSLLQDLRFAARQIRTSPGFTGVAALTLALGIGATTAIFSVVDEVALRPLPYPHAEQIVELSELSKKRIPMRVTEPNFDDVHSLNKSFAAIATYQADGVTLISNGEPLRANYAAVSPEFFDVLGAKPASGRFFLPDERQDGTAAIAVISYGFWQRQFGGAPSAIGSTLIADSRRVTVVGVLPADLEFPAGTDVIVSNAGHLRNRSRTAHNFRVIARLKPGVTIERAQQDATTIFKQLKAQYGGYMDASDGQVASLQDQIAGAIKPMLFLLLGASALLLLIACANVVNLLVARMASRETELAVRLAIGAGRGRLIQQLLVESMVLALLGFAGGLSLAFLGVKTLVALKPSNVPGVEHVSIDWRVMLFALAVSVALALALGFIAAWRGAGGDLRAALAQGRRTQAGGGASDRIRGGLVVVQVAMTVVLLVGAGLLARSFARLLRVDPGYRTSQLAVAKIIYGSANGPDELARRIQYYDDVLAKAAAIPGVTAAGGISDMPLGGSYGNGIFLILNGVDEKIEMKDFERLFQDKSRTGQADYRVASPGYFRAMGIPVLSGRTFTDADRFGGREVAVISASLARQRWPNENPIGKLIEFGNMDGDLAPITIVGVVGDVREANLAAPPRSIFYVDYRQRPDYARQFNVVMATASPGAVMAAARPIFRQARPDIPVNFLTIEQLIARSVAQQRFMLVLVGVFGSVALLLATLGVYSVVSYLVSQRGHELSIRVALGASASDIVRLVLGQGAAFALVGTAAGALGAWGATRVLKTLLYEISPTDPLAFAGVAVTLIVVALVASYLPARRAGRIAPMDVLRGG